jgi:hypothetical protein
MTVASTSVEAYVEHKDSGKLGKQATAILGKMSPHADYSRKELARLTGFELASVCGRVNELLAVGMLEELAARRCSITGKNIHPFKLRTPYVTYSQTGSLF